jgi:SpoVK/Ycf46/Vps4 family AAA+-type ATPase
MAEKEKAEKTDKKEKPFSLFTDYVYAQYPVLQVVSAEEARVEIEVLRAAQSTGRTTITWSHTAGFRTADGRPWGTPETDMDPIEALQKILTPIDEEKVIFLMRDMHPFYNVPKVCRLIRDVARDFRTSSDGRSRTLILLSPYNNLPQDLTRDVALIEFELPKRELIETVVAKLEQDNTGVLGDTTVDEHVSRVEALLGLTTVEAENAMAKAIVKWKLALRKDPKSLATVSSLAMLEKANAIKKTGILEYFPTSVTLSGVGGLANLKAWLKIRKQAFTQKARDFGLPAPRGLLLVGMPGCGKSLAAKACAANFGVPLIRFDVGAVFGGLVGQSEANMRLAIQTAEAIGRCVLWIDEIEKAFAGLGSSGQTDSGVSARVFGSFITWMQEKSAPVFIIATCNKIESLPPELTRKGRFDEVFFVDVPSAAEREEILKIHIAKRGRDPKQFQLQDCVTASEQFSGAELEEAVISALYTAFDRGTELSDLYIQGAIMKTTPLAKSRANDLGIMRNWANNYAVNASKAKDEEGSKTARKVDVD